MKIAKSTIVALGALAILFAILFINLEMRRGKFLKPGSMTVWVYDVGQGDAIFIDGPEKQILIDGGPDSRVLEKLSASMLPWDRSIDAVIVTHPHADHLKGLVPVLERYKVGNVFVSGQGYGTPEFFTFQKLAPNEEALKVGDVIDLGRGAKLTVLWPNEPYGSEVIEDPNDGSIVLFLEYGDTTMLLTGDAGAAEEGNWVLPHIDVLKVGHHGSRTSTSKELLEMTTADTAIISVAADNDYGLPDEDVLQRLSDFGVIIYRTDVHEDVRMWTDGGEPMISLFDF